MARRERGSGAVYKDAKRPGRWIGEVRISGKRRRVSGTKTEVRAKLQHLVANRITGTVTPDRRTTVRQALETFVERELPNRTRNGRPLAPGTIANYRYNLGLVTDEIGTMRIADVSVDDLEAMFDRLATRMGQSSLRKLKAMLSTAFTFAERRGTVARNVVHLATIPPKARRPIARRALDPDSARALIAAARDEPNGAMFVLSLRLGLRPGEASGVYWQDVDLNGTPATLNVTRAVQRHGGRVVVADELKTSTSKRTIELPADVVAILREHRNDQRRQRLAAAEWADPRLVFASRTGRVLDPSNVRDLLTGLCKRVGLPPVRPNELRHSCASLLADEGVPNEAIADLLGHTTTRMVDQTYRHRLRPVVNVAALSTWAGEV